MQAQSYPTKSIRFVVPVTTGGPSDLVARLLGERLAASLGKPVVVDNRPGASNTVGAAVVAKSEPDGYTLLQAAANMATIAILMSDLPFDPVKDFTPVTLTHLTPYVFAVSAQSPVKSLPELIKHVKDNPGRITYGTTGPGSPQQLATLLFAQLAGIGAGMTEISYKGSSAAHPDLIPNRISYMIDPLAAAGPHIKAGLLRGLAVTTPQRNPSYPDIPTAIEAGLAGYDFSSWGGVFAPAGTPRPVVQKLNAEIGKALAGADLQKRFLDMGLVAKHSTPEEFGAFLQAEIKRWGALLAKKQ
ncbi:MAG TPA: tripartite tricarboxylate transporter substrate binding protein [Burkholderiales bacterium]|nr:tripartite tricarboxylate transporter substrate binding protein [Burkholderiales bacterium]